MALKAVVLNVLSIAAAFGVLVLVFQDGWGHELLGFEPDGSITTWLPVFMFLLLFGLSTDYHVFIVSRIREAVDGGMRTEDAVRFGLAKTAGVVTSAAVVMVAVFGLAESQDRTNGAVDHLTSRLSVCILSPTIR